MSAGNIKPDPRLRCRECGARGAVVERNGKFLVAYPHKGIISCCATRPCNTAEEAIERWTKHHGNK